ILAGIAAFFATVLFNPFHLTNLTHTFVISVSEHAKMWRTVHEWHPAFAWTNPVGTGFPFLVMLVMSIGLIMFWLFSRFLKPRLLKAPKNEFEVQSKLFTTLSRILGYSAAVFVCWVTFISFSFVRADITGLFFCACLVTILLLSIYNSVHFIYLAIGLSLLALWSGNEQAGYEGRYIYPFVLVPAYVVLHIFVSLVSNKVRVKPLNIIFVAASAFVAIFLMMAVFDPFKFEQSVWHLKQFLGIKRIWHPAYEANLGLKYTHLFASLYIVNLISIVTWFVFWILQRIIPKSNSKIEDEQESPEEFSLVKIDTAFIVIAALTIYMAIQSRRFIPVAAIAACPLLALFIDQIVKTVCAARNFYSRNRFAVSPMSISLRVFFVICGAAAVMFFGTWWTLKFKRIYLDPWPNDPKLTSVFMRMTNSDAKPFYACRFIKDNKLEGKVFNYWTEGGFIAYGQQPDPNTGKTPLQLFMDGRAQAAYNPAAFQVWSEIMAGGPVFYNARIRGQKLSDADYVDIGKWIGQQMKRHNVWISLMPLAEFDSNFVKGIERNPQWQLVFMNNKQRIFVDIDSRQGRELFEGMFNGKTVFGDEFSKNLTLAHNMMRFGKTEEENKQALEYAIKAFEINPSQTPMLEIISAARFGQLVPYITNFCKNYFDEFTKNKHSYAEKDGYMRRLAAARIACIHLGRIAGVQGNKKLAQFYTAKMNSYSSELAKVAGSKRW
ncbi:MAG: hypothetical protein JXB29_07160, partial [Sedimentisphaerales bacterium]|nr:hypothetical protein [Sedimentisphaerales bacterium]